jgi:hypothetical protein
MPHTLDVWRTQRVLHIAWPDDDTVELGADKPGDWEKFLMAERHRKGVRVTPLGREKRS